LKNALTWALNCLRVPKFFNDGDRAFQFATVFGKNEFDALVVLQAVEVTSALFLKLYRSARSPTSGGQSEDK